MSKAHVQVVLGENRIPEAVRAALVDSDVTASFWPLAEAARSGPTSAADAVLLIAPPQSPESAAHVRDLFERIAIRPRGTLVVSSGASAAPCEHPATIPVSFVGDVSPAELKIRLASLVEMRKSLATLHAGALARHRSERAAVERMHQQAGLASRLQRGLMRTPPVIAGLHIETSFRPAQAACGDVYDVQRLDGEHLALCLADAGGSELPAALLSVFVRRALRTPDRSREVVAAHGVLSRLREELLDTDATGATVAAACAVLHLPSRRLSLAGVGTPTPLIRRRGGGLQAISVAQGGLCDPDRARLCSQVHELATGDALVLYSDGLERMMAGNDEGWSAELRDQGLSSALHHLSIRHDSLRRIGAALDDVTLLAVEVGRPRL